MNISGIFVTAFIVGFSGAMMPGPLLTFTISAAAKRGFIAGPLIVLGHALLELALVIALAGGLSAFMTNPRISQGIALVGGGFLLYLGYTMARDAATGRVSLFRPAEEQKKVLPEHTVDHTANKRIRVYLGLVLSGLLITLANPFVILWWATVGLGYVNLALKFSTPGLGAFYTGHILADLAWYGLVAGIIAGGRKFLSDRIYRGILILCGLFLIGLGGYFFFSGVQGSL